MAVYGGVSFEVEIPTKDRPDWYAEPIFSEQAIPGSNVSNVQFMGRKSPRIKVKVYITSDAGWTTLKSFKNDGVARSLTSFMGASFSNVYLLDVKGIRRDFVEIWEGEAEFLQGS